MIPTIANCQFFSRKNSVLSANVADGTCVPLVRFKSKFIDVKHLTPEAVSYTNRYMEMFPQLYELIQQPKQDNQLTLF